MKQRTMKILTLALVLTLTLFTSCTENTRARHYGGEMNLTLDPHEQFLNLTFKTDDIWLITVDTVTGTYYAREKSTMGVWEGKIAIIEHGSN